VIECCYIIHSNSNSAGSFVIHSLVQQNAPVIAFW
jgi:hypothetical protein